MDRVGKGTVNTIGDPAPVPRRREHCHVAVGGTAVVNATDNWSPLSCRVEVYANQIRPISRRHRDGSNLVFFDGHAEWMEYYSVMPITKNDPQYKQYWDTDEDQNENTP